FASQYPFASREPCARGARGAPEPRSCFGESRGGGRRGAARWQPQLGNRHSSCTQCKVQGKPPCSAWAPRELGTDFVNATRHAANCEVRTMLEVSITRGQATERSQAPRWVAAALLSAGLTYLFDPVSGRRRRARVRDLGAHWARLGSVAVRKTRTDLQQRARGVLASARARSRGDEVVSDETLVARVRARLGTVVSHPHAVEVEANEGTITLRGPILEHEAPRALRVVRRLRGVREIDDRLERHAESDNVPAL